MVQYRTISDIASLDPDADKAGSGSIAAPCKALGDLSCCSQASSYPVVNGRRVATLPSTPRRTSTTALGSDRTLGHGLGP